MRQFCNILIQDWTFNIYIYIPGDHARLSQWLFSYSGPNTLGLIPSYYIHAPLTSKHSPFWIPLQPNFFAPLLNIMSFFISIHHWNDRYLLPPLFHHMFLFIYIDCIHGIASQYWYWSGIAKIIETLRFMCLNVRKVSLVAICAVI